MAESSLSPNPSASASPTRGARSTFEQESDRLKLLLGDQLERHALSEARRTVISLLCLNPTDADVLQALALIDERSRWRPHPVGEVGACRATKLGQLRGFSRTVTLPSPAAAGCSAGPRNLDPQRSLVGRGNRQRIAALFGRLGMVTSIAFSSDGKRAPPATTAAASIPGIG